MTIIDFGYIDEMDAGVKEGGKFKSPTHPDIVYNCGDWQDATFYWCFNRALKAGEQVTITLTAQNGKTYTVNSTGSGSKSPRYAASFLNQLHDDVEANGITIGEYEISGTLNDVEVGVADDAKTVEVKKIPEELQKDKYTPVVAAAKLADTSDDPIGEEATEIDVKYTGTTVTDSETQYNITGTAKNLKKHKNANGVEGYWFGVEIKAPDGVATEDAAGKYGVTINGKSAGDSTFDTLQTLTGQKGAILYFDVKGGETGTYTVAIDWDNNPGTTDNNFTYVINLTNVERYGAASFLKTEDGDAVDSYGFIPTDDESGNDTLNDLAEKIKGEGRTWGESGITDCVDNTFYAAFKVDPANAEGKSYTVKFTKDGVESEQSYSETVSNAEKGGIVYFTPSHLTGTSNNFPATDFQGKYNVTVTKTGDANPDATAVIEVYKVTYTAGSNVSGETRTVYTNKDGLEAAQSDTTGFTASAGTLKATCAAVDGDAYAFNVTVSADVPEPTTYTVTVDDNITNGTVTAEPDTEVTAGTKVTVTVTPDEGYICDGVTVNGASNADVTVTKEADGTYTFTMPASNVTVTATFTTQSSSGGHGGSGGGTPSYSVSTPSTSTSANGKVSLSTKNATKGSQVTITVTPNKGYMAAGVTVKDANGKEIAVKDNGDGTYTFTMPDSKVTIEAEFVEEGTATPAPGETDAPPATTPSGTEENCPSEKFTDIDQSQWYHEGVDYALTNGLMNGTSDTTFEPDSTTTRAMIVSVFYRLDGSPAVAQAGFADVSADAWYADAVAWGEANGVVNGYSAEEFGPNDSITREQMAAILYRYAQYKGIDVSAQANLSGYADAALVSDWANTSLSWANAEGLISGMSDTELAPTGTATRAQVAAILMRFCENITK